ncbi:MAG: hypothetical protein AAB512_00715 [Patescibacteria group bacterium]
MNEILATADFTDEVFDDVYLNYLSDAAIAHLVFGVESVLRLNQEAEPRLDFNLKPAHPLFEYDIMSKSRPDWQDWKQVLLHHESYSQISKSMEETIGSPPYAFGYLKGKLLLLTAKDADTIKYGTSLFWAYLDGDCEVSEDGEYIKRLMQLSRGVSPEFHYRHDIPVEDKQGGGKWRSLLRRIKGS